MPTCQTVAARRTLPELLDRINGELEDFAYAISHDLKAPLSAIEGFAHLLELRLGERMDEREAGYLQRVRAATASMFAMVDAVAATARLARDAAPGWREVDLSEIARSVLAQLRQAAPERASEIVVEPGIRVWGDAELLALALRHVLENAWKFCSRTACTRIAVTREAGAGAAGTTVKIADNGAGFDPRLAARLFSPFRRLHHASEFQGSGMGLAVVRRIVHRHGGSVDATATPGAGAVFRLAFPRATEMDGLA